MRQRVQNFLLLPAAALLASGCATDSQYYPDVTLPLKGATVEFEHVVDVPFNTAYKNLASHARQCWNPVYSGETLSRLYAPDSVPPNSLPTVSAPTATGWISYTVPGKLLGSRLPLVSVRLAAHAPGQTYIVGTSYVFPNQWGLEHLDRWAKSSATECIPPVSPYY